MIAVQIIDNKIYAVEYKRGVLGRKKEFAVYGSLEEIKGKKALLIPAPEDSFFLQFEKSGLEQERDKKIQNYLKNIGRSEKEVEIFSTSELAVILLKDKISVLVQKLESADLKIEGIIPEQLAVYRLLKEKLKEKEEVLVLHLREQASRIYFINKKGPLRTEIEPVQTAKLIPVVQKLLEKSKKCQKGFLFGEKSMAFAKGLFEKEVGIELSTISYGPSREYVPAAAGSALFQKKEYLKYPGKESRIKVRFSPKLRYSLVAIGVAFVTGGIAVLGFRSLNNIDNDINKQETISQVPTKIPSPTPTLMPVVKPEDVRVRILNGSGVQGAAGVLVDMLSEEGFDVVETGNADRFDYEETEVRFKQDEEEKKDLVLKSLADLKIATPESDLGSDAEVDVEIILGAE